MPVIRLRKTEVDALPFSPKPVLWYDADLKGFGLRVSGSTKAYVAEARVQGRTRRVKIGNHGPLTADEARRQAKALLGDMARGKDPAAEKTRAKAQSVILQDAFDAFLFERHDLKPLTVSDMRKAMRQLGWEKRRVASITRDQVVGRLLEIGKTSEARANLTMRYLRAVLNFAAEKYTDSDGKPFLPVNPVRSLPWYKVERRRTYITDAELKPWWQAVCALENHDARDYLQLVVLTGLRRTEALELAWEHVDLKAKTLTITDPKNSRPHTLPLSDYLFEILEARKKSAVGEGVFESARGPMSNLRYALADVIKESGVQFGIHDLRRTFATVAERLDTPAYALKRLLNHKDQNDVTEGYVGFDVERLRKPMQRVTDYVLAASGVRNGVAVVPIKRRRKTG